MLFFKKMERDYYGLKRNKVYMVDPKKKVKVVKSSEKKRETLPEKMARKRSRLKKIRLSFVKKPKRMMRRAY